MPLKNLIEQHPWLAAFSAGLWAWGWRAWEKELKAAFTNSYKWLKNIFNPTRTLDKEIKQMKAAGVDGLTTLCYLVLEDPDVLCDRVTVMQYEELENGSVLATCLSEARHGRVRSVSDKWQQTAVPPPIWEELKRIHQAPERWRFVPDVNTVDVALMRAAMIESGVWSAYYQSLPTQSGRCQLVLAASWAKPHTLSSTAQKALLFSGNACATVWLMMEAAKESQKQ